MPAIKRDNIAYDFTMFEGGSNISTAPKRKPTQKRIKRKNNIVKLDEKQLNKNKRIKIKPLKMLGWVCLSLGILTIVAKLIVSQVTLTELTESTNIAHKQLLEKQSAYTQIEMKVESQFSLSEVENYATTVLGMHKTEPYQINYFNSTDGDKGEIVTTKNESWFDKVKNSISCSMS